MQAVQLFTLIRSDRRERVITTDTKRERRIRGRFTSRDESKDSHGFFIVKNASVAVDKIVAKNIIPVIRRYRSIPEAIAAPSQGSVGYVFSQGCIATITLSKKLTTIPMTKVKRNTDNAAK